MEPISLIISAVEIGATTNLTDSQKEDYRAFLEHLRKVLADSPDASFALSKLLEKPESRGLGAFLQEELYEIQMQHSEMLPNLVDHANHFIESVKPNFIAQQVIAQINNYNINISGGSIIGDRGNITQAF